MIELIVNGERRRFAVDPQTPLLWVLRDTLGLTGTKFGCGRGLCGACSVHLEGSLARSCQLPVATVAGSEVTTIEGIARNPDHPVLRAWIEEQVPQCGYCQPGQIMAATALLNHTAEPTDDDIDRAMARNICRCGTYVRIRRAIHRVAGENRGK